MSDKSKVRLNFEISIVAIIAIISLLVSVAGAWFTLPAKVMAEVDCKYVRKDVNEQCLISVNRRLGKLEDMMMFVYGKMGGKEKKIKVIDE